MTANGTGNGTGDSFPKLLLKNAAERGERMAMREKDLGIWQSWTWREAKAEVEALALGLAALGLARGQAGVRVRERAERTEVGGCLEALVVDRGRVDRVLVLDGRMGDAARRIRGRHVELHHGL